MTAPAQISPEVFPVVLGSVLIIASVVFTAFTIWVVFGKWRDNHRKLNKVDENLTERLEWVYGRSNEESSGEFDSFEEGEEKAILAWKGLSCSYPSKKSGGSDITTLSDVTGHIKYKELVAIMGGSGGGKSTLMDILSGRKSLGTLGGELSLLGETIELSCIKDLLRNCDLLRNVAAYIPQDEQFFPTQTPEEAVEFVANLKLGKDARGDDVRKRHVNQLLDLVGIPKQARTRAIGGSLAGGLVIRGLSGGERKRLALACAIAMKPKILFFDEITSGLDSENAMIVIDIIKKVCVNMNVAAVVVIHQPDYEVFSHFDRLILLSKGKCIFADMLDDIPSFYANIKRSLPEKHLIPTDMLKAASNWNESEHASRNDGSTEIVDTCGKRILHEIKMRPKPSVAEQFKTVLLRQMMNHYVRNITNLFARVLIYGVTALLLGCVFWKIAETDGDQPLSYDQTQSVFGAGTFLIQILYLLPYCQISTFFFDKNLFASESSIGLYPAWIYSLCQITLEAWVIALGALAQVMIAVPMISLWNPSVSKSASFVTTFAVFCAGGMVGNAIVMLTSIVSFSQDLAFLVGSGNVVFALALCGGFVPFPSIADWIVWLQWISPIKYSFQAFTCSLFSGTPNADLLDKLELDAPTGVSANIGISSGIFVICALGSVFALSRQREVR